MNDTVKNIFIRELPEVLSRIESLPADDPVLLQVSAVTELGNLRPIFLNMKFFLETGMPARSAGEYSSFPAVIFSLPALQELFVKEFAGKISLKDIEDISSSYFAAYKSNSKFSV